MRCRAGITLSSPQEEKWTLEEERVLREEIEVRVGMSVPRRQFCQELLSKYPSLFTGKSKADLQNKYIRKHKD